MRYTAAFIIFTLFSHVFSFANPDKGYTSLEDQNTLEIKTPSLKDRKVAKIKLQNGLQVLIVSDPEARKSAAALCVFSGSWSDPAEYPGMAHFLEHMLFMGTKAYPEENDFMKFIGDHGGSTNAFTAPDRTVYGFTINNDSFTAGLDRFSHFFIDPLFQTSGVQRELHAVDQEHSKNIRTDSRRNWMIFKETGNQNHPNRSFGTGNAKTLGNIPREALVSWYSKHYLAQNMSLVVYSDHPLEKLKDLIAKDFDEVPHQKSVEAPAYGPLSSSMQRGHIIYIKPVKDLKVLSLDFELPKRIAEDLETHSANLIAYTLRNGSENSLIEDLKRNHLAESLRSYVSTISTQNKFLSVSINLTTEGVKEIDTVISKCFEAINGLKKTGVPKYLFTEMQTMNRIDFEYQSRQNAFEFVMETAYELPTEDFQTYPLKNTLASRYDPVAIKEVLDLLNPEACIFTVVASPELTGIHPDKKEQWNGGEYSVKKVGASYLKTWEALKPTKQIGLPLKNPFIPEHLSLIHPPSNQESVPYLLSHSDLGKNYVYEDTYYEVPEISYTLGIKSPLIRADAKSQALLDLFIKTFRQKLSSLLSVAKDAGLYATLSTSNLSLNLKLSGYSERADEFLFTLLRELKELKISQKEYELFEESLIADYDNTQKAQPYVQGAELLSSILYSDVILPSEKKLALQEAGYEEFNRFLESLFQSCYIQGLYAGNLTKKSAQSLIQTTQNTLGSKGYPLHDHNEKQLLLLPVENGPFMVQKNITALGNAALLVIQESPFSYEKKASQVVLSKALSESFFDTLRSKQQTGYITASWAREVEKELLQFFVVQSATHEADDLLSRFEVFLEGFVKDFTKELPEERFKKISEAQIELLKKPLPNLQEMSQHLYTLAFEKDGQFNYNQELAKSLEALSYKNLMQDAKSFLSKKNTKRLAVLVEGDIPQKHRFRYRLIEPKELKQEGTYISTN